MQYLVCCVPVSAMKSEPSHRVETVSQQLFGEKCVFVDKAPDGWIKIEMKYDGYQGWVPRSHVNEITEQQYLSEGNRLAAGWVNEVDYNGRLMMIPMGSSLSTFEDNAVQWDTYSINYKGTSWTPGKEKLTGELVAEVAFKFLNTAYLWGGRSVFGIDCSGFSQMVYRFLDKALPRDAWQQAEKGEVVNFLQEVKRGDLAFFDNEEGRITHVGILLSSNEIIHAAGKVRIDKIDTEGILNLDTGQRTHKLRIIKRYF